MNTNEVIRRILDQRRQRFPDAVPGLGDSGSAPCRLEGRRLRVAFAAAAPHTAARLVAGVLAFCAARGYDLQWSVLPSRPGEAQLAPALLAHGMRQEESQRLMAHEGPLAVAANPRVTVVPITSRQAMMAYEAGSRAAFFDDPHPLPALVEQRAEERLHEQAHGWYHYFAALLDHRSVGGAYYTQFEDVPTIMGVYTVPQEQRQGVASTLLARVVATLLAEGHTTCCLYVRHGNPAEALYRKLGFVPLLDEYTFDGAAGAPF
jgi:GNAT superfamily N-acetyltransferase